MDKVVIDPKDKKYFIEKPGKDFSFARNKSIINQTIAETIKYFQELAKAGDNEMGNRIDILNSYGRYRLGGKGTKKFDDWAGRELTKKLIGEKILSKVRIADSVNKLQGNRKNSILL